MGNNGRFMDGVLIGALIGGAMVFLLGTKKGNKVLKVLTEEGVTGFSNLIEEFEERREGIKPAPKASETEEESLEEMAAPPPKTNGANHNTKSKPTKRFFRRSK